MPPVTSVQPRTWLKEAREAAGYTQMTFAVAVPCSITAVKTWEHGQKTPSPMHVRRIDQLLVGGSGAIKARFEAEQDAAFANASKVPA